MSRRSGAIAAGCLMMIAAGCARSVKPRALGPEAFVGAKPTIPSDPLSGVDNSGSIQETHRPSPDGRPEPRAMEIDGINRTVRENLNASERQGADRGSATTRATTTGTAGAAATRTAMGRAGATSAPGAGGAGSGEYLTVGGVVAEVNGQPIYTDEVLAWLKPRLIDAAHEEDPVRFRQFAMQEISGRVEDLVKAALQFAAAERTLDAKQKELADMLTMQWRQQQISEAGGSLELAKRKAAEQGTSFEELARQQRRRNLRLLYLQKKIYPRVQVTAQDRRDYYNQHQGEFTTTGQARFRLIKIGVRETGGREQARRKIGDLRDRAVRGEDFAAIASSVNDDPRLLKSGGDLGSAIQKGAFALEGVEKAVWATPAGAVTPVVETTDAFYLAKVEDKRPPRVIPFDEEGVQQKIYDTLANQQLNDLVARDVEELKKEWSFRMDPQMMNTALDVAMQDYYRWTKRR
jgi:parvulin-like peptidyl-prolyl isomerase